MTGEGESSPLTPPWVKIPAPELKVGDVVEDASHTLYKITRVRVFNSHTRFTRANEAQRDVCFVHNTATIRVRREQPQ